VVEIRDLNQRERVELVVRYDRWKRLRNIRFESEDIAWVVQKVKNWKSYRAVVVGNAKC